MGATPKDPDEKVRRGYRDPKTIVWVDGRERLEGYDWTKRVREVKRIAGGQCERLSRLGHPHALGCRDIGQDAHHIEKRSILRDDRASNLAWLSRACHNAEDNRKIRSDRAERRQQ